MQNVEMLINYKKKYWENKKNYWENSKWYYVNVERGNAADKLNGHRS